MNVYSHLFDERRLVACIYSIRPRKVWVCCIYTIVENKWYNLGGSYGS